MLTTNKLPTIEELKCLEGGVCPVKDWPTEGWGDDINKPRAGDPEEEVDEPSWLDESDEEEDFEEEFDFENFDWEEEDE